ncbi:hypothetical protein MEX01_47810 [Methylorubrum extorquens]|uniref:hypothetical protein n=1 Tax=Methylorubrum extorquens TaxID=408 RepID=UPI00116BB03E|nr:hypothetical protein [Methylorubrum extorquens]GEL44190.1 hypothetical protein MEX01_47810 [Methylorubrum extorquens]
MIEAQAQGSEYIDEACLLVGKFLYNFSIMEKGVDAAIYKLFDLQPEYAPIISLNMDFARKVNILQNASVMRIFDQNETERQKFDKLTSQMFGINQPFRARIAHAPFEPDGKDAVIFAGTKTKNGKQVAGLRITRQTFNDLFGEMRQIVAEMRDVLAKIRPLSAVDDVSSLSVSELRSSVSDLAGKMREFEEKWRAERNVDDWEEGWQARSLAQSTRRQADWRSELQPQAVMLLNEMRRRLGQPQSHEGEAIYRMPDFALMPIEQGSLAGANPLHEAAMEMERLARSLLEVR